MEFSLSVHIVVPDERAAQLRKIAEERHTTVAEVVGLLLNHAYDTGLATRHLPGIEVRRAGKTITVDYGSFTRSFRVDLAETMANALRFFSEPKLPAGFRGTLRETAEALSGIHEHAGLSRRGTSVVIGSGDERRVLAPSVARDLANMIEEVAKRRAR